MSVSDEKHSGTAARQLPATLRRKLKKVARRLPTPIKVRAKRMMPWLVAPAHPSKKKTGTAARKGPARPDFLSGKYKNRATIQDLVYRLAQHDVISFDVFDTLLVRPFLSARDLFSMLELELNQPDFRFDRIRAENEARNAGNSAISKTPREVTLRDIYDRLHQRSGLDIQVGMQAELHMEARYCRANEYIVEALYSLLAVGKKVVLTADTHFSSEEISHLLNAAGIEVDVPIFVSSEHGVSKRTGELYDAVRRLSSDGSSEELSFIHVGSDRLADVTRAQERGWNARLYTGIHNLDTPSWTGEGQSLRSSAVMGLINVKFGNVARASGGNLNHYALGYRYGGPMVFGYVDWLQRRARELQLDKLVFLSPGGYLPHLIAQQLSSEVPLQYLPWSARSGLHGAVRDFKSDWIDEFVTRSSRHGFETAEELLTSLSVTLDPALVGSYLDRLDEKSSDALARMFQEQWDLVLPQILDSSERIRDDIARAVIGKRIGVVAAGLTSRDLLYLRSILNDRDVIGFQLGSVKHQRSEAILEDAAIENYMFGRDQNIGVNKTQRKHRELSEAIISVLFDAPQTSVIDVIEGELEVDFLRNAEEIAERPAIRRVLAGAVDFVDEFRVTFAEGAQLRGLSGATAGALYVDLVNYPRLQFALQREFPTRFGSGGRRKARDA